MGDHRGNDSLCAVNAAQFLWGHRKRLLLSLAQVVDGDLFPSVVQAVWILPMGQTNWGAQCKQMVLETPEKQKVRERHGLVGLSRLTMRGVTHER